METEKKELPELQIETMPAEQREAAERAGWKTLMPVQARAIPYLLAGRDMIIQARTGSGKTGAFLLPMLTSIDRTKRMQALILVPTRELAVQVCREAQTLCGSAGLKPVALYGGVGYGPQVEALKDGAHIIVGTPGRILDHMLRRTLVLDDLAMLIFDEADRMLSMGFYPDMLAIQRYMPRRHVHSCMFSATFPDEVKRAARAFIKEPEFISLSNDHVHVTDTAHVFYKVPGTDKDRALVRIIEIENPTSAIIFCNTRANVHYVAVVLSRFGYDADELSADRSQQEREQVLDRVRKGTLRFLVATDVAARGIDIPALSHVFMYETPEDSESYIHRAGRTGRAGATGVAITLVNPNEETLEIQRIARTFSIPIEERVLPTDADVSAVVTERITALLEARLRERDNLAAERSRRFIPLARSLAESEDESAIIAMLLDDYYQKTLHVPPGATEMPKAQPQPPRRERSNDRPPHRGGGRRR